MYGRSALVIRYERRVGVQQCSRLVLSAVGIMYERRVGV